MLCNVCLGVWVEMRLARVPGYANVVFTFQLSCSEFIWIFGGAAVSYSFSIEVWRVNYIMSVIELQRTFAKVEVI